MLDASVAFVSRLASAPTSAGRGKPHAATKLPNAATANGRIH
jgi:hypothetical protein